MSSNINETADFIKKSPSILRDQIKYCNTMLKALRRHPDSGPFLDPVDPVALNVPDYYDIIKHPMDLTTLQTNLNSGKYADNPDLFINDTRLIFSNCYTYNGINSQISEMAKALEKVFDNMLKKMPKEGDHSSYGSKSKINHSSTSKKHPKKVILKGELKFCKETINEMLKKKYTNINIPFLEPVDPIALGVPDYYNVITNPMDLSTLRKKLESGEYETADQFEHDCRLIFSNCYTYNHPDSEVYKMGQSLEEVFNNKWKHRPITKDSSSDKKQNKKKDNKYTSSANVSTPSINHQVIEHSPLRQASTIKIETNEYSSESDSSDVSDKEENKETENIEQITNNGMKDEEEEEEEDEEEEYEEYNEYEEDDVDDEEEDKNAENLKREINQLQKTLQICTERLSLLLEKKAQAVARKAKKEKKIKLSGKSSKTTKQKIPKLKATKITKPLKMVKSAKSLKEIEKNFNEEGEKEDTINSTNKIQSPKKGDLKPKQSKHLKNKLKRKSENEDSDSELDKITEITMEQKKELSESINKLPPEKLGEVIQIIQESMSLETGQEEIELDIDSFDPSTLYRLYRIVVENKPDIPLSKRRKIQKEYSKQHKISNSNMDEVSSSSSISDTDSDDAVDKKKKIISELQIKSDNKDVKIKSHRGSRKISDHPKKENSESSKEEIKISSNNKPNTPSIRNQQKSSSVNETSSLNKTNNINKINSSNNIEDNKNQSQFENSSSKIEDISEYIDNYVAAAKNDKKQKEIEVSQRERSHDWRKSKLNELHSWNEKDLKVTSEMEEKRKKYIESLNEPMDEKMKWEHNKTLMQNFCRESDQFSLDNPGRIRTQLDKIKNSNLDIFPWMDTVE
jgi:hypothetical protein